MLLVKTVVFAALVVALAVNVVAWRRYDTVQRDLPVKEAMHEGLDVRCENPHSWQCSNTRKWLACWALPECLVKEGVAI